MPCVADTGVKDREGVVVEVLDGVRLDELDVLEVACALIDVRPVRLPVVDD